VGDVLHTGEPVGCDDLWEAVKRVRPQHHVFGHIHEGYGLYMMEGISFVNPSICDHKYGIANKPLVFEVSR
jgi:Icc-related predicted phosphoesterase